jgi:RNA polymerase sigma-B factor
MTADYARTSTRCAGTRPSHLESLDAFRSGARLAGELLERCKPMSSSAVGLVDAMATVECRETDSADEPLDLMEVDGSPFLEPGTETDDREMEQAEARIAWHQMVDELDPRLKKVIELRFYQNLTQLQTARRLGVSQTLVSRLERSALDRLRCQALLA